MKNGVVMFIYKEDVIQSKAYHSLWERKEIVKKWEQQYKRQWGKNCVIQIVPTCDINAVLEDGTNKKHINDKSLRFTNEFNKSLNTYKMEKQKGTYVSRSVHTKLQMENHRLLKDIKTMVMDIDGKGSDVFSKWRSHFKSQNDFNNMLREIAKKELPKLRAKIDSNPNSFK